MLKALTLLPALLAASASTAQVDAGTPSPSPKPSTPQSAESAEDIRKEVDAKVENAKKEMQEEIRAQIAAQHAGQAGQEEWVEQTRKLERFEIDGYFRVRPELLNKMELGREPDPDGYTLFPRSPFYPKERTQSGANMRLRLEPTINVSEEVRAKMQIDVFDNLVFGSTPGYAYARQEREQFSVLSMSQASPKAGINSVISSIAVKRAWGEVTTPIGILRFGRMGSHFGLGMFHNDGNCIECDFGETVDRGMFVFHPANTDFYITPMFDINVAAPTTQRLNDPTPGYEISNSADSKSYVIAVEKLDTERQAKSKLDNNLAVFNYGVHFTYRTQRWDPVDFYNGTTGSTATNQFRGGGGDLAPGVNNSFVARNAQLFMPDVWVKYQRKYFRFEMELAGIFGNIKNRALSAGDNDNPLKNQSLTVVQFGGVAQGEYRFLEGALRLQLELGFASGDPAPGFGNFPNRVLSSPDGNTRPGDIDGPQYQCQPTGGCSKASIRNFRFARDYRVDMILWRELLGGVTDSIYVKPTLTYQVTEGLQAFGSIIGSRAVYKESTPSSTGPGTGDPYLGIEFNVGGRYETSDGFFASMTWGIFVPLGGLGYGLAPPASGSTSLDTAQVLRGLIGVKF